MSKVRPMFFEVVIVSNKQKNWTNAFIENHIEYVYENYDGADSIRIEEEGACNAHQMLMSYVLQFESGGFWLVDGIMYVITAGINSDKDATYEDAKEFIKNWKINNSEGN